MEVNNNSKQSIMDKYYDSFGTLFLAFMLSIGGVTQLQAQQDPNFTLYTFNMNIINPAFAGSSDLAELNMVYRNQFIGIEDAPRTVSLTYSTPLAKKLGIGVSFVNDQVYVLRQTDFAIDFSYMIKFSEKTNVYFGLKLGGASTNIDLTRAQTNSLDPLFTQNQSFFNPNIGAGINIQNENYFISLSTPNFLKGERYEKQGNFPAAATNTPHFYFGGGYFVKFGKKVVLSPRFMMRTVEGAPSSYDIGMMVDIHKKLLLGANYRVEEMMAIFGLFELVNNVQFGLAYDISVSDLNILNDSGSLELILKYRF